MLQRLVSRREQNVVTCYLWLELPLQQKITLIEMGDQVAWARVSCCVALERPCFTAGLEGAVLVTGFAEEEEPFEHRYMSESRGLGIWTCRESARGRSAPPEKTS